MAARNKNEQSFERASAGVLCLTGDAFKSARLERMLADMTNSYKIFWLRALVDEILGGAQTVTFRRMSARMVAAAWYPVTYFHLNFGRLDKLGCAVACCRQELGLGNTAPADEIVGAVESSCNAEVRKQVDGLCEYVPYRLIRLYYEEELQAVRERDGKLLDRVVNTAVFAANRANAKGAPYVFGADRASLTIDADWASYILDNAQIVCGWLDMRLVEFLQARNPSVPAIPLKIRPPQMRDLSAATSYWKEALALRPMREIYSGRAFSDESFGVFGPMSIDHFIPWSFVMHDEPWDLVPMFRDMNSSKNDKLPRLEDYLAPFAEQQFDALMAVRNTGRHCKVIESYMAVAPEMASYEDRPECRAAFADAIGKLIRPLHQIALNQGFALWTPHYDYAVVVIDADEDENSTVCE